MASRRKVLAAGLTAVAVPASAATAALPARRPDLVIDRTLHVGGADIEISFLAGALPASRDDIFAALDEAARAVTTYYGRFPVTRVRFAVEGTGRGLHATTWGHAGGRSFVHMRLGPLIDASYLRKNWVITHEMVHLACPDQRGQHRWIEEGLATYIEPIARAQLGVLGAGAVWRDAVDGMPRGLPQGGDKGLDGSPTWGRTYWGGALFCLLADVGIRTRTGNRAGLQQAMRGVLEAGGSIEQEWPLEHIFELADSAVGVPVLTELYQKMRAQPEAPDLAALWRTLGIRDDGGTIAFDDSASGAAIRRAITAAPAA